MIIPLVDQGDINWGTLKILHGLESTEPRADNDNMPLGDQAWWNDYRDRVQRAAATASSA